MLPLGWFSSKACRNSPHPCLCFMSLLWFGIIIQHRSCLDLALYRYSDFSGSPCSKSSKADMLCLQRSSQRTSFGLCLFPTTCHSSIAVLSSTSDLPKMRTLWTKYLWQVEVEERPTSTVFHCLVTRYFKCYITMLTCAQYGKNPEETLMFMCSVPCFVFFFFQQSYFMSRHRCMLGIFVLV